MPQLLRAIRPMFKSDRWRICRDDIVYILSGPDKGKTGKVLEIVKDPRVPRVIVEGRNLRKKKVRTGPGEDDYFVVTMEAPLHYSQVQLADPDTGRPIRVVFKFTPDGQRVRARKVPNPTVNDIIPTPPEEADPRAGLVGSKDTPAEVARRGSYMPTQGFPFRIRNLERIWAGLHPDEPAGPQKDPDAGEVDNDGGGSSSSRSSGRRVLFTAPAIGGARGMCTAAAAAPSQPLASSSAAAGAPAVSPGMAAVSEGVLRGGGADAADAAREAAEAGPARPATLLPRGASFALSGLQQQRRQTERRGGAWWGLGLRPAGTFMMQQQPRRQPQRLLGRSGGDVLEWR